MILGSGPRGTLPKVTEALAAREKAKAATKSFCVI